MYDDFSDNFFQIGATYINRSDLRFKMTGRDGRYVIGLIEGYEAPIEVREISKFEPNFGIECVATKYGFFMAA